MHKGLIKQVDRDINSKKNLINKKELKVMVIIDIFFKKD